MGSTCECLRHKFFSQEQCIELNHRPSNSESALPTRKLLLEFGTTEALSLEPQGLNLSPVSSRPRRSFIEIIHETENEESSRGNVKQDKFQEQFGHFDNSQPLNDGIPCSMRPPVQTISGSFYSGEWDSKGRRHGRGTENYPDGSEYTGYFSKDQRSWKGRLTSADGTFYQGHFSENLPNGFGFYIDCNGSEYQGTFKAGIQEGNGKEKYTDGSVYQGQFSQGKKHGEGVFKWTSGKEYHGSFSNGLMSGNGVLTYSNGRTYKGFWKKGKMHGHGEFIWENGIVYIGGYFKDKKHGKGEMKWPDGRILRGKWKNGVFVGTGILEFIDENGSKAEKEAYLEDGKIKYK